MKCWGSNSVGQLGTGGPISTPVDVTGLTSGVASIGQGYSHICAVATEGDAKCWGYNASGQLGDGGTTNRLTPVDVQP